MLALAYGALVVLGIGLLIFVHEFGHFAVAKKVGIRVEAFSLGFGPKVIGFRRGDTEYKICAIPLGGYVKMAGEAPGEETGATDEFASKSIMQRVWVVSAGVIMNVIFAFMIFPVAFSMGVPFDAPVVGRVVHGDPAWEADIRAGDRILEINGTKMLGFADVRTEVAFTDHEATFVIEREGQRLVRKVIPRYNEERGFNEIGIYPALEPPRFESGAAALAAGIAADDVVLSVGGIRTERLYGAHPQTFPSLFTERAGPLELRVRNVAGAERTVSVPPDVGRLADDVEWKLGISTASATNQIERMLSSASGSGREEATVAERIGLRPLDEITAVNGTSVATWGAVETSIRGAVAAGELRLNVRRGESETELEKPELSTEEAEELVYELFPVYEDYRITVDPDGPAQRSGLRDRDIIAAIGGTEISRDHEYAAAIRAAVQESRGKATVVALVRDGRRMEITVTPEERLYNRTLIGLESRTMLETAHVAFPESISEGCKQAVNQVTRIFMTLRSIVSGRVAAKNVGGIIMIATVSYTFAEQGLAKLLFFLAILSLNLAIINILPIPVLDGGHLVFLACEAIKGGPLSDRAMGYANIVGLVLILALMVFVTFNDIVRFFF